MNKNYISTSTNEHNYIFIRVTFKLISVKQLLHEMVDKYIEEMFKGEKK